MKEANGKIEFIYQYSSRLPRISMVLSPDSTIPEVLEAFEAFLRSAGYEFDGIVEINGNIDDNQLGFRAEEN